MAPGFTVSYERLGPDQRRRARLLGLHPGRDVEPYAAATLADVSVDSSVIEAQASAAWATLPALY